MKNFKTLCTKIVKPKIQSNKHFNAVFNHDQLEFLAIFDRR